MTTPSDDLADFVNDPTKPKSQEGKFRLIHLLTIVGIFGLLILLNFPAPRSAREAARRSQCVNNLKQIALALHHYESVYNALPPAYTVDAAGKPLHSWRTLILPYLEQQALYESIDLTKPWNDPANAKACATEVWRYRCPNLSQAANTSTYLAIVAPDGCFLPGKSRRLSEITDDPGLTLMVIEASPDQAVPWMAPIDANESSVMSINEHSNLNHPGGLNAACLNGSVRFLKATFPAAQRRAMMTIAGNDDPIARALD